ncbi:AbrB/MazE/SpoVT family DNA-binding domain-containing protein [Phosphitispora fastidiosa]|uniref:AbrB/MazE/SpoVT family DNA-binding domain-containing protein n=1 Tax=Phosphitispora fastidiosa TaxID=2837202 RepID=UPI001E376FC4|nr:AbrB/MazE/SpoVT family DNA-binding domain-containing protein [Phosphitispora fastidiosa]MBU7006331.1 transcriptional pleiotropic regulator of transition state genes [Phosphitispora fastidiosa]
MKATGVVRKVDELGRVVIPIELRRTLEIDEKDSLEFFVDGEKIILRKYEPACVFCSKTEDIIVFRGKRVCKICARIQGQMADELESEESNDEMGKSETQKETE